MAFFRRQLERNVLELVNASDWSTADKRKLFRMRISRPLKWQAALDEIEGQLVDMGKLNATGDTLGINWDEVKGILKELFLSLLKELIAGFFDDLLRPANAEATEAPAEAPARTTRTKAES